MEEHVLHLIIIVKIIVKTHLKSMPNTLQFTFFAPNKIHNVFRLTVDIFYANIKIHKKTWPYRYIVSCNNSAIEKLAQWVEYQLKSLA